MTQGEKALVKLRECMRECGEIIQQWEDGLLETNHALNLVIHKLASVMKGGGS